VEIFGDYRFLSGSAYITGILLLGLGFLVISANPRSRSCQFTFLFNLFVSIWSFGYATMFLLEDDAWGLFVGQFLTFNAIILNSFLTHFILITLGKENAQKKFLTLNYAIAAIMSIITLSSKLFIQGLPPKLDFPAYTDAGPLYFLVPLYLFANLFYDVQLLVTGIKERRGYRKNQLTMFLLSIVIAYATGTPAFLLVFNIPIKPVTTPFMIIYPSLLTYTIMKHQFLDVRKLIKNTLVFSLLFVFLLGVVSMVLFVFKEGVSRWIGIPEALSQAIAIALAIGFYGPLKAGLSKLTNRILFQQAQNPETIFTKLSEDIIHYLDAKKLAEEVTSRIAQILALERIGFYLRGKTNRTTFELQASVGTLRKKQIPQSKQLIQHLERAKNPLINPYIERENQAAFELTALGGVAAFPVFVKDVLRAVLVIGPKKSDASWTDEEFQILKSFMRHISLALTNCEYAEEIARSREKLSLSERDASAGALIAGVDHEVKNPIHAMSLQLSALSANLSNPRALTEPRAKLEEMVQKTMTNVRAGIIETNNVIEHLSDLADKKPLRIEENVKPLEITERVIRNLNQDGSLNRIKINLRIPENLSLTCDSNALYEILVNLVRNAEQAIPRSDVTPAEAGVQQTLDSGFSAKRRVGPAAIFGGRRNDKNWLGEITIDGKNSEHGVVIEISDTGTGISKERMARIFEPFFTTKNNKKNSNGTTGTGMGLFIAKEYIQSMGGKISAESEVGKGTKFRLEFPNSESTLRKVA
jgi:signal transduction histidine kinase